MVRTRDRVLDEEEERVSAVMDEVEKKNEEMVRLRARLQSKLASKDAEISELRRKLAQQTPPSQPSSRPRGQGDAYGLRV